MDTASTIWSFPSSNAKDGRDTYLGTFDMIRAAAGNLRRGGLARTLAPCRRTNCIRLFEDNRIKKVPPRHEGQTFEPQHHLGFLRGWCPDRSQGSAVLAANEARSLRNAGGCQAFGINRPMAQQISREASSTSNRTKSSAAWASRRSLRINRRMSRATLSSLERPASHSEML